MSHRHSPERVHIGRWLLALLGAAGLVLGAAACGGGDDDAADAPQEAPDPEVGGAQPPVTLAADGEPQEGGKVIYAVEAETDGWNPWTNRWAPSGVLIGLTVYDPIAAFDDEGVAQPYLAESLEPNEDFTEWDITVREGVTFHNGDPLTAEAIQNTLENHRDSLLTSSAFGPLESVDVIDDRTARVFMSTPWALFPSVLTAQGGVVPNPNIEPDALDREPDGTGPFEFDSWTPDRAFVGKKNDNYWREGLPYLNEVEFTPIVDPQTRMQSLQAGNVNMMYTTSTDNLVQLRREAAAGNLQVVEDQGENEESLILLNTTEAPFDDIRVRRALAHATDKDQVIDVVGQGIYVPSNGPFGPRSPWFVETDYPQYDPDEARRLVEEYAAEVGPVSFTINTTPVTANLETLALLAQQWQAVGMEVQQDSVDQQSLINNALTGGYQAQLWRQFGSTDPDLEWHWWHRDSIDEGLSLNMARNDDDELSDALDAGRATQDLDDRREAYARMQERMAETIPYVWLFESIAAVGATNNVRGLTNGPLPDGEPALPIGGTFPGITFMTQVWVTG